MPVLAENIETISKDGHSISIIDTYSTFDEESNEVTIHLLPCRYAEDFKREWTPEYGFLKCFPISKQEYFSAPGASLIVGLNDEGKAGRVIFSTAQIGDKTSRDYQGFSKSWFRNPSIA